MRRTSHLFALKSELALGVLVAAALVPSVSVGQAPATFGDRLVTSRGMTAYYSKQAEKCGEEVQVSIVGGQRADFIGTEAPANSFVAFVASGMRRACPAMKRMRVTGLFQGARAYSAYTEAGPTGQWGIYTRASGANDQLGELSGPRGQQSQFTRTAGFTPATTVVSDTSGKKLCANARGSEGCESTTSFSGGNASGVLVTQTFLYDAQVTVTMTQQLSYNAGFACYDPATARAVATGPLTPAGLRSIEQQMIEDTQAKGKRCFGHLRQGTGFQQVLFDNEGRRDPKSIQQSIVATTPRLTIKR
jgi:hypothetical protein